MTAPYRFLTSSSESYSINSKNTKLTDPEITILICEFNDFHTEVGTGVAHALHRINPRINIEVYFPEHEINCFC